MNGFKCQNVPIRNILVPKDGLNFRQKTTEVNHFPVSGGNAEQEIVLVNRKLHHIIVHGFKQLQAVVDHRNIYAFFQYFHGFEKRI